MNKKSTEQYLKQAMKLKLDMMINNLKDAQLIAHKKHFEAFPKKLYKYSTVNDNSIDAIKNNYIYLCPAEKLDDQFECRVDFSIEKIKQNQGVIDDAFVQALVNKIDDYPNNFNKKKLKEIAFSCLDNKRLDLGKVNLYFNENEPNISDEQKKELLKCYAALSSGAWKKDQKKAIFDLMDIAQAAPKENGIGSLTENKKSQIMWEFYADHYKGICIEYDLYGDIFSMINTYPVIYTKKRGPNLLVILTGIVLDSIVFCLSHGKIKEFESAEQYIKMFLTKNDEWSFQKEWRIIGAAGYHCPVPKVKKIFLGKHINNDDQEKLITIAKEKNIQLYKQLDNYESLEIKYEKMMLEK